MDCILLVEDNEDDVLLFKASLEDADILNPVHVVGSAENAISYLAGTGDYADRSLYPLPRVVFVDLHLPGKSGHDILEWMLREPDLRDVLKVVLTGSKDPRHYTRALELGANAYLEKPVTKEQLTGPCRNLRMVLAGANRPGRDHIPESRSQSSF